jgi:beta-phosphoglucomutase-like phosphatase (HAD superfamily)
MASSNTCFQEILSKFKKRLTQNELENFQFATLEDVRREMARIQLEQANRKEMMHMPRIQSFLEAMDQFGKVIEVFLNSSEFVAFVWGPIKFLLQVRTRPKHQISVARVSTTESSLYRAHLNNT